MDKNTCEIGVRLPLPGNNRGDTQTNLVEIGLFGLDASSQASTMYGEREMPSEFCSPDLRMIPSRQMMGKQSDRPLRLYILRIAAFNRKKSMTFANW
jgi:hypothetical protein